MYGIKHVVEGNEYIHPDGWPMGECIKIETDNFTDSGWPGCDYRINCINHDMPSHNLAVNIKVTGKPRWFASLPSGMVKSRIKIEFPQDGGEPSHYTGGWIFHS